MRVVQEGKGLQQGGPVVLDKGPAAVLGPTLKGVRSGRRGGDVEPAGIGAS